LAGEHSGDVFLPSHALNRAARSLVPRGKLLLITPKNAPSAAGTNGTKCIYLDAATTIFFGADGVEALASAFRRGCSLCLRW